MRAFLAVPAAADEGLRSLGSLLGELREVRGLRPVGRDQLHFTLKFFEELPDGKLPVARGAAERSARRASPFTLVLRGLGTFPPHGPARVLWVGCGDGAVALSALAEAVEQEFAAAGFRREARPFSPHLTLARVKEPRAGRAAADLASANAEFAGGVLGVRELVLYASVLGPSGAAHTPLGRFPLGGP